MTAAREPRKLSQRLIRPASLAECGASRARFRPPGRRPPAGPGAARVDPTSRFPFGLGRFEDGTAPAPVVLAGAADGNRFAKKKGKKRCNPDSSVCMLPLRELEREGEADHPPLRPVFFRVDHDAYRALSA